jgi:hypothetical protein
VAMNVIFALRKRSTSNQIWSSYQSNSHFSCSSSLLYIH